MPKKLSTKQTKPAAKKRGGLKQSAQRVQIMITDFNVDANMLVLSLAVIEKAVRA